MSNSIDTDKMVMYAVCESLLLLPMTVKESKAFAWKSPVAKNESYARDNIL